MDGLKKLALRQFHAQKQIVLNLQKKYKTYQEFKHNAIRFYRYAITNNLIKDYTWLKDDRVVVSTDKIDSVYAYFFEDQKAVYVGRTLTKRLSTRDTEHLFSNNDSLVKFSKSHDIPIPKMTVLESGLTIEEGLEKEEYYIDYYKKEGYEILNKHKTGVGCGSIGSLGKGMWNEKTCYDEAKKYTRLKDFEKKASGAYKRARIHGWIKNYIWLQKGVRLHKNNKEDVCHKEALKYDTIDDFIANSPRYYQLAKKNDWLKNYPWLVCKNEKMANRITAKTRVKI